MLEPIAELKNKIKQLKLFYINNKEALKKAYLPAKTFLEKMSNLGTYSSFEQLMSQASLYEIFKKFTNSNNSNDGAVTKNSGVTAILNRALKMFIWSDTKDNSIKDNSIKDNSIPESIELYLNYDCFNFLGINTYYLKPNNTINIYTLTPFTIICKGYNNDPNKYSDYCIIKLTIDIDQYKNVSYIDFPKLKKKFF
jgi:hypothetical protein